MTQTTGDVRALDDGTPPTVADVDRIAAHTDPVVRNLQITHCYHRLSRALAARTGGAAVAVRARTVGWPSCSTTPPSRR